MSNASVATIMNKLADIFAPMDVEVLEATKLWAKGRVDALKAFKASDEYQELRRDAWSLYPRMFAICGGKVWYNIFNDRNEAMINEFVAKNCEAISIKRNASIASKLAKAGVSEVISEEFTRTKDGFNGVFVVNTNTGRKVVTINTVRAGGYNIQCLHLRVLVKIK